ncbi:MAG: hypothetical protein JRJ03_17415 [Deltaproteobacteria bacterium]|nr:hypothetical protein [Deltaproteobacteria bacterium]MBW2066692.1 hypothetical protein [Deltaproteobacteria bacterium]
METNRILETNIAELPVSGSGNRVEKDNGFKEILEREVSQIGGAGAATPPCARVDLLARSERILDLLDAYARDLHTPSKTLRDMEPLVKGIQEEAGALERQLVDMAPGDTELGNVIREVAVIASVAAFKFYRGDYMG